MGKIRVKTLGIEDDEKKQAEEAKRRAEEKRIAALREESAKRAEAKSEQTDEQITDQSSSKNQELRTENEEKTSKKESKYAAKKGKKTKSKKYVAVAQKVEKNKMYSLSDALKLLPQLKLSKFDETVELHINTTETGVSGSISLPHGTGKQVKVAIANDAIITEIESGTINFDVLVAEPSMMPKLAKVARILGPRGLMPNPKNGTVSPNPEEVAKKFAGGQMNYKTESKFPLLHVSVGKLSFSEDQLTENIKAFLKALPAGKVKNVTLKSTMSPAIKLNVSSL